MNLLFENQPINQLKLSDCIALTKNNRLTEKFISLSIQNQLSIKESKKIIDCKQSPGKKVTNTKHL
jgi:hypothetical protein